MLMNNQHEKLQFFDNYLKKIKIFDRYRAILRDL